MSSNGLRNPDKGATLCLVLMLSVSLLLLAIPMQAQVETTSSINGTVMDSTGGVVVGAAVTVKNQNTGGTRNAITNSTGYYSFPSLSPGTYSITVSMAGFKTVVVSDRVIQVAQPASVDVKLSVGASAETVNVSAAGAELIDTTTSEISGTISSTLVQNLPLNGHDMFELATLTPGTSPQNLTDYQISFSQQSLNYVGAAGTFVSSGIFAGGNRDSATNVSIDGSNVQSPVYQQTTQLQSTASVEEMRIETSNMNAEFGGGVSAVNVITKSGSNQFHGEAYEYFRNNYLDAAGFFTNLAGLKLPTYQQNQFGGAVGGPIKKGKLFFFANYEGLRVRQGNVGFTQTPPVSIRGGDFSTLPTINPDGSFGPPATIYNPYRYDPATGLRTPFPNNQIPLGPTSLCAPQPTCVDPVTLAYLQYVLTPNKVINGIPMLAGVTKTMINEDQGTVRVDFNRGNNAHFYGRFTEERRPALAGGLQPLNGVNNASSSRNIVVHWAENLSANSVNDFLVSYSRPKWILGRNFSVPDVSKQIGLLNTSSFTGGPQIQVAGYDMGSSLQYMLNSTANTYQLKDDYSAAKGRHQMKLGVEITERRNYYPSAFNDKGYFNFENIWTAACPSGNAACASAMSAGGITNPGGNAFADYLLGAARQDLLTVSANNYQGNQRYYGFYAQDSWRVTPKLTLNYGLRYEYWSPWLVPSNTVANFNFQTGQIEYALQNPLDYLNPAKCYGKCAPLNRSIPRQGYTSGNRDFAPRIGLAYLLTPKTPVRASFGKFYDGNINNNFFSNLQHGIAPFNLRNEVSTAGSEQLPPLLVQGNFPPPSPTGIPQPNANPPAAFRVPLNYYPTGAVLEWSLSVQHLLSPQWSAEVDYTGSHTVHEFQFINENAAALPVGPLANLTLQQRRPFPQWGDIGTWAPIGWGRYNALVASVKNTGWRGLTVMANFAWAKNIVSSDFGSSDIGNENFRYPYIHAGDASFTPRTRFIAGYSYQLPFGKGKSFGGSLSPALDKVVGGWSLSGITQFSTGAPLNVISPDFSGTGLENYGEPNRICNPNHVPGGPNRLQWFNTSCFVAAPYGTYGNSTLGSITAAGINNWDLTLEKSTPVNFPKESGRVDFRLDMFNVFNHTQWGSPDVYYTDLAFGQIFSTRPARQLQVTLKYVF
jgi:hypothetical protein